MKTRTPILVLLAVAFVGCSSSSKDEEQADAEGTFELYSLQPGPDPTIKESEQLYGCEILGKTSVKSKSMRKKLLDALKEADGSTQAKCFYPRHLIRRMEDGKEVDLVICFECCNSMEFRDGEPIGNFSLVAEKAQSVFDSVLKKAGIPLADKKRRPKD